MILSWDLTGGGPGYATDVPNTLLYKNAFTYSKFGYANAIAVIMIVLCLVITVVTNRVFAERQEIGGNREKEKNYTGRAHLCLRRGHMADYHVFSALLCDTVLV